MSRFGPSPLSAADVAARFPLPADDDEDTGQSPEESDSGAAIDDLTVEQLEAELERVHLFLDRNLIAQAVSALRAGKHLMLSGPPGTGKTTFGEAIATVAHRAGICAGLIPVTATADWTSSDTVGAYRLTPSNELEFRAGQLLQSIDQDKWIVIDELNRADIDKAIGQLFTVLSGQPVVLPFVEDREDLLLPPSIVPAGKKVPDGTHPHRVSENWRVIATLNDRDRDLLFDMSEALMRRFAVIEVGPPSRQRWIDLLKVRVSCPSPELDRALLSLSSLKDRPLGPAIIIDCGRYLNTRWQVAVECGETISPKEFLQEAIDCYIAPHLKDIAGTEKDRVDGYLRKLVNDLLDTADQGPAEDLSADVEPVNDQVE